jgi:hypothetical protein
MDMDDLIRQLNGDTTVLTPKQISVRLPILVAAKLAAAGDLYMNKPKSQLIGDFLTVALDQFEASLPSTKGKRLKEKDYSTGRPVYEDIGTKGTYRTQVKWHLDRIAEEAGVVPMPVPKPIIVEKEEDNNE